MIITHQHSSEGFKHMSKMLLKPLLSQYVLPDHFIIKRVIVICRGQDLKARGSTCCPACSLPRFRSRPLPHPEVAL